MAAKQATGSDARKIALRIAQCLGALWTLPNTLVGLVAGLGALASGAQARLEHGALVFHGVRFGPGGALTLGQVILHTGESLDVIARTYWCRQHGGNDCVRIGDHERAHVYQYLVLGPFFLPLYFLCGGISWRNRFEQAADRYALTGKGWWPWLGREK
jgi:hypothetical protein